MLDYAPGERRSRWTDTVLIVSALGLAIDLLAIPLVQRFLPAPFDDQASLVLILSAGCFCVLSTALIVYRRSVLPPRAGRRPRSDGSEVCFGDAELTFRRADGTEQTVRWADLRTVSVETTSTGPFEEDVYFVLLTEAGGCVVPNGAAGVPAMVARLQKLPGFDHAALIRAMSCTEDRSFLCWRQTPGPSDAR